MYSFPVVLESEHTLSLEKQVEVERALAGLCITKQNFQQIEDRGDCFTSLHQILSTCVSKSERGMRGEEQNLQSEELTVL